MESFINDLAKSFQQDLNEVIGRRKVSTPFPDGLILIKAYIPKDGECQRDIACGY